jgi:flagellar protein FliO/FliZ
MEFSDYLQFAAAFVFVLGLIGVAAFIAKWLGVNGNGGLPSTRTSKRLRVVERHSLDAKRHLMLVRRDDVEHLILIGATTETLVESNIEAPSEIQERGEKHICVQTPGTQNMPAPLRDAAQKVVHMFTRESSS